MNEIDALALAAHERWAGKFDLVPKMRVTTNESLSIAYTPGVAAPCRKIADDKSLVRSYTMVSNTIAVVTDGSAVLGLGNIGPAAALPVMEGKAVLFKQFGGVNAFPICLDTQDVDEIVHIVKMLSPGLGGINLEDISAPRCFEIESRLKEELDIPVFHDDQHGTAIVVLAACINGLRLTGKDKQDCKVVINGAGSAGIAIAKLLHRFGFENILLCDRSGIVHSASERLNEYKQQVLEFANRDDVSGTLADALVDADVFIGVSGPNMVTPQMVSTMAEGACVFALANPDPEIMPDDAISGGARVVGTGRSDYPNQINNVIAFPGIFKGALAGNAGQITEEMKLAAAQALASLITDEELREDYIIVDPFDPRAADVVAEAVLACL